LIRTRTPEYQFSWPTTYPLSSTGKGGAGASAPKLKAIWENEFFIRELWAQKSFRLSGTNLLSVGEDTQD